MFSNRRVNRFLISVLLLILLNLPLSAAGVFDSSFGSGGRASTGVPNIVAELKFRRRRENGPRGLPGGGGGRQLVSFAKHCWVPHGAVGAKRRRPADDRLRGRINGYK